MTQQLTEQVNKQLKEQREHDERVRQEAKAERAELEAKMETLREEAVEAKLQAEVQKAREEARETARPKLPHEAISEEQLAALQARLQALHDAQLLTDEERDVIEDTVADCIEAMETAVVSAPELDQVRKMIVLSEKISADAAFARQLRRKFV